MALTAIRGAGPGGASRPASNTQRESWAVRYIDAWSADSVRGMTTTMTETETMTAPVEIRETDTGPVLHGVILEEGRAARGSRAELFAPGAVVWPAAGIAVLTEHHGRVETRAVPVRSGTELRISTPATPAIQAAVHSGRTSMSVEFHAIRETRTVAGIREIERALVDAVALTTPGQAEYKQTPAELRERRRAKLWL